MASRTDIRWFAVCVFAVVLGASACDTSAPPPERKPDPSAAAPTGRIVEVVAGEKGFVPESVEARPGEPLVLRFTRTAATGCLSSIAIPAAGIERDLPLGRPVDVAVSAPGSGALEFQCGMGMVRGRIVVSAEPAASAAPNASARAHADHDAHHGGVLTMEGDYHVEIVVATDGTVELWVTDAVRGAMLPTEITGSIEVRPPGAKGGIRPLPLAPDVARGALTAKGPAPTEPREYTWDITARGQRLKMTLAVPAGGTSKLGDGAPAGSASPSASAAHGNPGHKH